MMDDWGRLMAAAQAGDKAAYRRLLDDLGVWLGRYYRRRLPEAMVDDAVQDALIAVHTKRATWDPARPFAPWLAAIARYKWIDRLRALSSSAAEPLPEEGMLGGASALVTPDQGSAVLSAKLLDELLATLKPAQAQVIRMVRLMGYSIAEAAEATGQSEALVKVNIHRGLGRLAARVEESADAE